MKRIVTSDLRGATQCPGCDRNVLVSMSAGGRLHRHNVAIGRDSDTCTWSGKQISERVVPADYWDSAPGRQRTTNIPQEIA